VSHSLPADAAWSGGPVAGGGVPGEGMTVGRYRLLAKIGEGGMGVVHLAQAPDGSRVAVKVLRPHVIGDDEARERLAREVSSLRLVRSDRVAEVLDADPWGPMPFVATRYVPGLTLHEHVRQEGRITGRDLAHLATGLVEALIAVHQVGVLHRDVKPANALLEGRSPVLIDFGLARLAEDPRLTHTGWLLGTPGYLAPEILYGDDATTASDVHSWAATVVFAATGAPPFGTGPAMAIMDRVRRGEHDLSAVPSALAPLVRGCLAPDPADRPATFEVLAELRRTAPRPRPAGATAATPSAPAVQPATMPIALAGVPEPPTEVRPRTRVQPVAAPPTRALSPEPVGAMRQPYQQPPPPRPWPPTADGRTGPAPAGPPPRSASPVSAPARTAVLVALLGAVTLGAAWAPYLSLVVLGVAVWLVRTASWTTEAAHERRQRRGRPRWYDAPLALTSTPWYLLVATFGTVLLLGCAIVVALALCAVLALLRAPLVPSLVVMGGGLALSLWWGPGARRVRRPVRRAAAALARGPGPAWLVAAVLAAAALACAAMLADSGVVWDPAAGAPWRAGTSLDVLLTWL